MVGRSVRMIRTISKMLLRSASGFRLPRRLSNGTSVYPCPTIASACRCTRVAITTSRPQALAACAMGRKCDTKAQSSGTKYNIFDIAGPPDPPRQLSIGTHD